jgi:hypothetical protein
VCAGCAKSSAVLELLRLTVQIPGRLARRRGGGKPARVIRLTLASKKSTRGDATSAAFHAGGSRDHSLQLTGLQPGQTYEWQILTRDGDVRTSGQFQTAATANGTAPDVNASSSGNAGTPATTGTKVPLYRFVSTNSDRHTYSASASAPSGFRQEGTAGYLMQSQVPGTVPLYSLTSANDEMLSTNAAEGAGLFQNSGVVGYIATSQQPGTVPLYRLVSTQDGKHFATANPQEHAQLLSSGQFKDDGTIGYIWQQ